MEETIAERYDKTQTKGLDSKCVWESVQSEIADVADVLGRWVDEGHEEDIQDTGAFNVVTEGGARP